MLAIEASNRNTVFVNCNHRCSLLPRVGDGARWNVLALYSALAPPQPLSANCGERVRSGPMTCRGMEARETKRAVMPRLLRQRLDGSLGAAASSAVISPVPEGCTLLCSHTHRNVPGFAHWTRNTGSPPVHGPNSSRWNCATAVSCITFPT